MKEDSNKGGWTTPGSKGGKGKKKGAVQVIDVLPPVEEVVALFPDQTIDTLYPRIDLKKELVYLKPIFRYTEVLRNNFGRDVIAGADIVTILKKNPELVHATIFCFKAIGTCFLLAKEELVGRGFEVPLFWNHLIYLRNALIHHVLDIKLPDDCLKVLAIIVKDWSQIFDYISFICDSKSTYVPPEHFKTDLERYKRFHDVHALTVMLRDEKYPREMRKQIEQGSYLKLISQLISVVSLMAKDLELTKDGMVHLRKTNPVRFYAIQDCLEFIATLTSPTDKDDRLLEEGTHQKLVSVHKDADRWFGKLGESRNAASHGVGAIDEESLAEHTEDMCALSAILKERADQQKKYASAPILSSPAKVAKNLGIQPKVAPQKIENQLLKKAAPKKSGIIAPPLKGGAIGSQKNTEKQSGKSEQTPPKKGPGKN